MKEGIDVTGIPGPNPMLGCGIILFVVGVVAVIAISGYLLFNASLILQMLFYGIWAIVVGIILIVLCLKAEKRKSIKTTKDYISVILIIFLCSILAIEIMTLIAVSCLKIE